MIDNHLCQLKNFDDKAFYDQEEYASKVFNMQRNCGEYAAQILVL